MINNFDHERWPFIGNKICFDIMERKRTQERAVYAKRLPKCDPSELNYAIGDYVIVSKALTTEFLDKVHLVWNCQFLDKAHLVWNGHYLVLERAGQHI